MDRCNGRGVEYDEKNQTWKLVKTTVDKKVIGVKLVFKTKLNVDGSVNNYKARHV